MEIDFIVLWKAKKEAPSDLHTKVEEMLVELFEISQKGIIPLNDKKGNQQDVVYKCKSTDDNKVFLKFECSCSEAKAAEILSQIPEIICKGKHRKDFSIICTYDEVSLSYCCRLMKPYGTFERRLRELVYIITVKAFGVNWVKKSFPEEMISKIKEKSHGNVSDERLTEIVLELLDYNQIIDYLFEERYLYLTPEEVLNNELSADRLENLSKEQIVEILSRGRKDTLWNKIFSQNEKLNFMNQEKLNELREYRNDIMHHHTIDKDKYTAMRTAVKQANKSLLDAINEMENKIYTDTENFSVLTSIHVLLSELSNKMRHLFDDISFDFITPIENTMKILSDSISKSIPKIPKISFGNIQFIDSSPINCDSEIVETEQNDSKKE